jgi:hypothetical protein
LDVETTVRIQDHLKGVHLVVFPGTPAVELEDKADVRDVVIGVHAALYPPTGPRARAGHILIKDGNAVIWLASA